MKSKKLNNYDHVFRIRNLVKKLILKLAYIESKIHIQIMKTKYQVTKNGKPIGKPFANKKKAISKMINLAVKGKLNSMVTVFDIKEIKQ